MTDLLQIFTTLPLAEQFRTATVLIIVAFLIVLGLLFVGPVLIGAARDLFDDDIENDAQRLADAKRRAQEELRRQVPRQVDAGDRRAILEAIAHM